MSVRRRCASALLLATLSAGPTSGQQAPPSTIDVTALGPQVGERIADFRLADQTGASRTRDSLMGPNGLMLVFSRSADWCPYCKTQIVELQSRVSVLREQGLGLAVITYDPPGVLSDFASRRGITFPLLSDPGSSTIRAYGILNTTAETGTRNYGIPFPGTFIVNRQGVVTSRFFEAAYQERSTVASILLRLGSRTGDVDARQITTDHLQATTYLSDPVAAPGTIFSLVADVTPKPGMHVYAPGAHSYQVVRVSVDPQPVLVTRPATYPASEMYLFEPLNERVEVYQQPFRLVLDLSLSAAPEARKALAALDRMTITGTLEYQACSDTVCYLPQRIPLSYTIGVRPLDTERPAAAASSP
jgi:peroxiredoxin